jgi:hypothetical protein
VGEPRRLVTVVLAGVLTGAMSAGCAARGAARPAVPQGESAESPRSEGHKSYVLPAVEIVAMDLALNLAGGRLLEPADYRVTPGSIRRNLRGPWVVDEDPFQINQFGHPYQGAMYHGIARSNGLGYWPSALYTFTASALWEIAGESTPPSRNDQIASGIAGSFLGEPLFRIARLLLDRSDDRPGVWRKLGSVLASPPTGINHLLVGAPAGSTDVDAVPSSDIRVQIGASATPAGSTSALERLQPRLALSMDYGYPGSASYRHERPFDYFRIESSVSSSGLKQLSTRGLIAGRDYGGQSVGGVWGLYGVYDYLAPADFRFSSTAFSVGTTLQASGGGPLVVQGSALVGGGYVATRSEVQTNARGYHYGAAPQGLLNLRLILGRRAALDLTTRQYYVSTVGGFGTGEPDFIAVGDASLAFRIFRKHALNLTYQLAGQNSRLLSLPNQARSTVGVFYTFLGSGGFGAVLQD